jgi:D-amino-acid dehydrogenase
MTVSNGSADAVVVGGGIVGVCVALQLQRTGRKVMLIERGGVGQEASGHNGGAFSGDCLPTGMPNVIRSLPHMLRDPLSPLAIRWRYLPQLAPWLARFALASTATRVEQISAALGSLMSRGVDAYRPLIAGTEAEAILQQRGLLFGYQARESLEKASFALGLRARRSVPFDLLDAGGIAVRYPSLAGRFQHGICLPRALFTTDPRRFTLTLADRFLIDGGQLLRAEVKGFQTGNGAVRAVVTGAGSIATEAVVICAGPWSRRLVRQLGSDLPLGVERGYGVDLPDPGVVPDLPVVLAEFNVALTPHQDGVRLSGLDELAGLSAPPDFRLTDRIVRAARIVFPELRTEGARNWMRRRPSMPDSLPVIGRAPARHNVYLAFGHGHKGLCMAAITGKLVRQLIDGKTPSVDLAPFSPTRFSLRARRPLARRVAGHPAR